MASDDGLTWTRKPIAEVFGEPAGISLASDGGRAIALVVPDDESGIAPAIQRRSLWAMTDGTDWTRLGAADLLDAERGLYVTGYTFAAGQGGYLAIQSVSQGGLPQIGLVTYVDGSRSLTVDARGGTLTISDAASAAVLWEASFDPVEGAGDLMRIDPSDASADVVDPESGEVIFEVTVEIAAGSAAAREDDPSQYDLDPGYTWYSADGRSWTAITTPVGALDIQSAAVGDVVLIVSDGQAFMFDPARAGD